jgi:ABC-type Fe3+ transport system substrate-binding protein
MTQMNRRVFIGAAVSSMLLAGCGAKSASSGTVSSSGGSGGGAKKSMSELLTAAKKEGGITIYHATALDEEQAWASQFSKKYGIKVTYYRATTGAIYDRVVNEVQAGKFDVDLISMDDPFLLNTLVQSQVLAGYKVDADADFDPKTKNSPYYYPLQLINEGIAWNTKVVSASDVSFIKGQGWNALPDARWKGKYATSTPVNGGTIQIWWWYPTRGNPGKYGPAYLDKLAALKPQIFTSKVPLFDQLASGGFGITDCATETTAGAQYLKGAPIEWMYPDPTPVSISYQGVAAKSPHPNAARLFQEWATGTEGQEAWATVNQATPANTKAKDLRKVVKESWFKPPTTLYTGWIDDKRFDNDAARNAMYAEWKKAFGQG